MLCNPQNPTGRVFSEDELIRMANVCMAKGVVMCSDEIHCELLLEQRPHRPLAALSPEIADRTITFMAPSKTFNLAGLRLSFAVVQNADLRKRLVQAARGLVASPDILAYPAARAAYGSGGPWLKALLEYLTANRNHVTEFLRTALPQLRSTVPEATFLTWIDCREADIPGDPYRFFVDQARLALNDGQTFGPGGEGFVRLNFGCPRQTLDQALTRMYSALRR
jgi:cystathionine beta-lyase